MTAHPATYTTALLPILASLLPAGRPLRILDPFAGTGKVALLTAWRPGIATYGTELEAEWAAQATARGCGTPISSALHLPYPDHMFDAIVTSPTYGNRMADHHAARDASPRHTYRHVLGHPLHPENTGAMQWGSLYCDFHLRAWAECRRVLQPGGLFILNIKDHIRQGVRQPVTAWHVRALTQLGFTELTRVAVPCPGQRHGANGQARVNHETIIQLRACAD